MTQEPSQATSNTQQATVTVACRRTHFPVVLLVASLLLPATASAENAAGAYERTAQQLTQALDAATAAASADAGYDAVFRRDPTRPIVDAQGQFLTTAGLQGGPMVQGIIWSDERPLVVVDDELFAQSDQVGPYTITSIQVDGITVQRGEEPPFFIPLDRDLPPPAFSAPAASSSE